MCLGVFGVWKYEMVGVGACCVVMVWAADGEGVSSKNVNVEVYGNLRACGAVLIWGVVWAKGNKKGRFTTTFFL